MKKAIAILLVLVMAFSLVSCGNDSGSGENSGDGGSGNVSADGKQYGGTLRIVNTSEGAASLGIPWEVIGIDIDLLTPYCESLVLERTNGEIEPWLAKDWEIDTEALTITFHLQEGIKFHDGSDFNAEVAAWNLQQASDASVLNPAVVGIEATGEYELLITLDEWANSVMAGFASHSFGMISKKSVEENGIEWARENPVGTGPFKLEKYTHGESIRYVKNEDYWQEGKPYLDAIEYIFMSDVMTQNAAMQQTGADSIDVLNTNSAEQIVTMENMPGLSISSYSIGPVSLIPSSLDESSPLSKLEVRQAISYAIDRDALIAARGFGILTAGDQFIPEGFMGHLDDSYNLTYNQQKAKDLLAEAGYPNGFSTKIYVMPGMVDQNMAVAVQSMLGEVGINVELEFPDSGGYSDYRYGGWDGLLMQHTRSLSQVASTFALYFDVTEDEENGGYKYLYMPSCWRPDDELYAAEQAAGKAPEADDALLGEIHKIILDNMVCIPVYNIMDAYIIRDTVHDTGFAEWGASTRFLPQDAWKES